ncbi:MAG TPA: hypothetical protein VHX59_17305 [Mycobacteriales bacterium]|jgi:hypothetical protein|nr:hypothetical protein [Mycobacteriales bacterium]
MSDLYQVNWTDLSAASDAALGHANFTDGQIGELVRQAQALQQQYRGNAALSYVTERLQKQQKIAENHKAAFMATHSAHSQAQQIASSTEAKNVSIVT